MGVTWSILIATHVARHKTFDSLVRTLAAQVAPHDIEVVVYWNRGGSNIGAYRQALLEESAGEYVSFVDDDDRLPPYFCSEIVGALQSRPDYVGFELKLTDRTRPATRTGKAIHSLEFNGWSTGPTAYLRDVTHLNPIRRELAVKGSFDGVSGEDRRWSEQVRPYVRSQVYVDRVMYFYDYNRRKSLRGGEYAESQHKPPRLPDKFRYHPDSDT
jgi:hypothetical protein